ncbi:MAG: SGNH/GDSL hydrolase family protein [Candidatus Eremiobacteraeota bacterium]|nr:SGNH/GDSL hydrolase family protein [Candidatus Eremiobacteraeota bacterium]
MTEPKSTMWQQGFGKRGTRMVVFALVAGVVLSSAASARHGRSVKHVFAFLGDSVMCSLYSPPGYPVLIKKKLNLSLHNLTTVDPPGPGYFIWQAKPLLVPRIPADTTDAVIGLGTDDILPVAEIELGIPIVDKGRKHHTLAALERDMTALVKDLKKRHIRVFLITVKNYAYDPKWTQTPPLSHEVLAKMQVVTDALDDFELGLGAAVFDVRKYPELLASSTYTDGIHFNPAGLQLFVNDFSTFLVKSGATQ